ncbi:uncharacterized protein G2W53_009014 [Senna tora]|uniref:Uncharacterized protein n=1 Tax=Senna tora TaxID=362788 RepID=A0A834WWN2_9FABA|nr:uncharacterized protein G2W53_009014 [Senna tora]
MKMEVQIDRTSSIEREPRTLSMRQMQAARDLAIYVLNTNTIEEANAIFTQGLEPVVSVAWDTRMMGIMDEEGEELNKDAAAIASTFRDIVSAPF